MKYRKFLPFIFILIFSCESRLYPPTDPPVLSNLVLTSTSYDDATTSTFEGDTVLFTLGVEDPEEDPDILTLSITSGGTAVQTEEYSDSRIHDGNSWEGWFETEALATGSYTLDFTATDKEGNVSETLSQDFTIETDIKGTVTTADLAVSNFKAYLAGYYPDVSVYDIVPPGYETNDELFTVGFDLTNNSMVKIDLVYVPFTVFMEWDNPSDDPDAGIEDYEYSGTAIVSSIDPGETAQGVLHLNILNGDYNAAHATNIANETAYDESVCAIEIY
ncbi:MAG: hypothetical protein PQJ58_11415 [Spirochaetales bacterium]|nr:hypothetical protein [Spirochaetales bacterium]